MHLLRQGSSSSLNPLPIRDIMINRERQRILEENIAPINRLFDLGSNQIFEKGNLVMDASRNRRMGQQDCKDFFICLFENKEHWFDVFHLFRLQCISFTTCSSCNNVSEQDIERSNYTFLQFDCPLEDMTFSSYIESKLSNYDEVSRWRDEGGCKRLTVGKNSTRIKDMDEVENLLIVLNRLSYIDGNLVINNQKVPLGNDILLKDIEDKFAVFTPIGVIHHSGEVIGNTTRGHYRADVLQKSSCQWFRTSDDEEAQKITRNNVSDQGYIFLYKKHQ